VEGLSDAAKGLGTLELEEPHPLPFISGNVSFYNESSTGNAVPPSPIVCCLGVLPDASTAVGLRLAAAGDRIVLVGERRVELGGSEAAHRLGQDERGHVPTADFEQERRYARAVLALAEEGSVAAAHDVSSGGLLVALAEMMLGSWGRVELGVRVDLDRLPEGGAFDKLFSETGAYLLELAPGEGLPEALTGLSAVVLGTVTEAKELRVGGEGVDLVLEASELEESWGRSFRKVMD
jgi:phosphoribosylformylglycinamidine synthase